MLKSFLRLAALAVIAILLALLLGPALEIEQNSRHLDKLAHAAAFFLIAASLRVLFPKWSFLLICALALAAGAAIEVIQGYVGRDPSWGDLAADAIGIGLAWLSRPWLHRVRLRLVGED